MGRGKNAQYMLTAALYASLGSKSTDYPVGSSRRSESNKLLPLALAKICPQEVKTYIKSAILTKIDPIGTLILANECLWRTG